MSVQKSKRTKHARVPRIVFGCAKHNVFVFDNKAFRFCLIKKCPHIRREAKQRKMGAKSCWVDKEASA